MLSSAIRVHQESGNLVVVCPPFYVAGIFLLLMTLGPALFLVGSAGVRNKGVFAILLPFAPFVLIAVGILTSEATLVLSPLRGTAQIHRRIFGIPIGGRALPLRSVKRVFIEPGRGIGRLALLMQDGPGCAVGYVFLNSENEELLEPINQFLKASFKISSSRIQ